MTNVIYHTIALAAGFLLDLIFGDPRWLYHPVCLIGNLISVLEKGIRRIFPKTNAGELAGGGAAGPTAAFAGEAGKIE